MNERIVMKIYNEYYQMLKPKIGTNTTFQSELLRIGKQLFKSKFRGVFPKDRIPSSLRNNHMYIINLDNSTEAGSHWCSVYAYKNNIYLYDSFGRSNTNILPELKKTYKNKKIIDCQRDKEQKKSQNDCGLRSMVTLVMFSQYNPEVICLYL